MNRLIHKLRGHASPPTLASQDAYAQWAINYPPEAHNALMRIEQTAMLAALPPLTGLAALDLACGSGRYSLIAQKAGAARVVGIDNSAPMLRANPAGGGICGEMDALPFTAHSFDVILCGLATGHLPPERMRAAIVEMARVLRPGGSALVSDFHPFMFLSGGRRTFTAPDGTLYAVEHYPHLISDYLAAIKTAGLTLESLAEPRADGMIAPAVLVMRCGKGT